MSFMSGGRGGFLGSSVSSAGGTFEGDVTFNGNVAMAAGKTITAAAGSLAAPSIRFAGSDAGTGFSAATPDQIILGRAGVAHLQSNSGTLTVITGMTTSGALIMGNAHRKTPLVTAGNYVLLSSDRAVVQTSGTTLQTSSAPTVGFHCEYWNATGGAVTLSRSGTQLLNGATSVSIPNGSHATIFYYATDAFRVDVSSAAA